MFRMTIDNMRKNRRVIIFCLVLVLNGGYSCLLLADDQAVDFPQKIENKKETVSSVQKTKKDPKIQKSFKTSLTTNVFVIETDENTASESLDRVSGQIDKGFSAPENTFKSSDHYGVGPFAQEKAEAAKNGDVSY